MVVVLRPNGQVVFANAAFENVLSLPRRSLLKRRLLDLFSEPVLLESTLAAVVRNEYTTGRLDGLHSVSINLSFRITLELLIRDGQIIPVNVGDHDAVY